MKSGKVGARIAKIMQSKDIDAATLAGRTGLNVDFLNRLESEDAFPSLGPMLKIARALGVRLGTLLDDQVSADPLIVRGADQKEEIHMLADKDKPVALKFYFLFTTIRWCPTT
ncbi:MAG: helix-turn-helix domain-containing protein [Thermodesulfobacteriota bacterium]